MHEDTNFALNKLFNDSNEAYRDWNRAQLYYIREFDSRLEEIELRLGLRRAIDLPTEQEPPADTEDDAFL